MPIDRRSALHARNVRVGGRRTSVKLEPAFWDALEAAAAREGLTVNALCGRINAGSAEYGLTAAIRVFLLAYGWSGRFDAALATGPADPLPRPAAGDA